LLREKLDLAQQRVRPGGPPTGKPAEPPAEPISGQLAKLYVDTATRAGSRCRGGRGVRPGAPAVRYRLAPLTAPLHKTLDMVAALDITEAQRGRIYDGTARELFGLGERP